MDVNSVIQLANNRSEPMRNKLHLILLSMIAGGTAVALPNTYAQNRAVLEEIVVTAQKREQSVRDVAVAVSVVSGAHIDDYSIFNFQDLERISAGLSLAQANPRNVTVSLRGVTFNPESGTASAVDVYQNNVVQRGDNIFGAIYDMERVEVLRGAQGSVQGATSPAGAIILHTKQADIDAFSGYAQSTYTEANEGLNLQAAFSIPIIQDKLGVRIAIYRDENDANNSVNVTTGRVQDRQSTSFRGSLRFQPNENLEINFTHQNNDEEITGTPALEGTRSSAAGIAGAPGIPCAALALVPTLTCASLTRNDNRALAANDAFANREADITTLNLNWTLGKHELSYVFGKTQSEKASRTENDASNNVPLQNFFYTAALQVITDTEYLTHQTATTQADSDTHELRFASIDNPTWDYMVGLYYNDQKTRTRFDSWSTAARYIPLATFNNPLLPVTFTGGHIEGINFSTGGVIPFDRDVKAIFTAHSFQFNEKTALEVALRYQEIDRFNALPIMFGEFQQRDRISIQGITATSATLPDAAVSPTAVQIADSLLQPTLNNIMLQATIIGVPEEFQKLSSDSITGSVRFKYDFSSNFKSYMSWNRAFRSGGVSIAPGEDLATADLLFDDETSDSFEFGAKIIFLEGAGEINIALFHQIFDGFLGYVTGLEYVRGAGQNAGEVEALTGGLVYNGDATFSGIDLDWRWLFSPNYQMGGSFSYTKAEFDNASIPCNVRTGTEQLGRCSSSERIPGSPEFSANLFAEYSLPIGATRFFVRGNAKYNGGIVATRAANLGNDPGETDAFALVDLFVGLDHDNWEVSVWAKNLFDDATLLDLTNPGDDFDVNNDFSIVRRQQERSFGFTAKVVF